MDDWNNPPSDRDSTVLCPLCNAAILVKKRITHINKCKKNKQCVTCPNARIHIFLKKYEDTDFKQHVKICTASQSPPKKTRPTGYVKIPPYTKDYQPGLEDWDAEENGRISPNITAAVETEGYKASERSTDWDDEKSDRNSAAIHQMVKDGEACSSLPESFKMYVTNRGVGRGRGKIENFQSQPHPGKKSHTPPSSNNAPPMGKGRGIVNERQNGCQNGFDTPKTTYATVAKRRRPEDNTKLHNSKGYKSDIVHTCRTPLQRRSGKSVHDAMSPNEPCSNNVQSNTPHLVPSINPPKKSPESGYDSDDVKKNKNERKIRKKLREISRLEERHKNGGSLNFEEHEKLKTKSELEAKLKKYENFKKA